jgi:tRNA (adenine9-N1/guanine9-N1)-methyltransferase
MMLISDVFQLTLEYLDVRDIALSNRLYKVLIRELNGYIEGHKILHLLAKRLVIGHVRICKESVYGKAIGFYKGITIGKETRGLQQYSIVAKDFKELCIHDVTEVFNKSFIELYPKSPLILFDAILWELHSNAEKKNALKQLLLSLNVVRRYLTDLSMSIASPSIEIKMFLKTFKNRITITNWTHIAQAKRGSIVVLDPYADRALTESEVINADVFVLGLLVDNKFPRPFATYAVSLLRNLEDCERRAIVYKGHVIGVPREINKIVEILMRARFEGVSIDTAVENAMGVDDKINRVIYEAMKYCRADKAIDKNAVKSLMKEFGLDERYYGKVLFRLKRFSCWRE